MFFTSARLQNYRSYTDSSFEFESGVNIIVGPNASGKTNLLDSLLLISTGHSIKSSFDFMIKTNQPWARIDVLTNKDQSRVVKIYEDKKPEFEIDKEKIKKITFNQSVPVVLFEPNQLYQITTSPEQRRIFIDETLNKTDPDFNKLKNTYLRILRQRNSLLKQPLSMVKKQIFAWDIRLCEVAGEYSNKRHTLINKINQNSNEVYSRKAGDNHKLALLYDSKIKTDNYSNSMLKTLQSKLELDHLRGFTGVGPHRDDISIKIDSSDVRNTASRGETRSILLTLKIIEADLLESIRQQKPLLLLDDVFGELDGARRKSLIELMSTNQTFITTTDADIVSHDFSKNVNCILP